MTPTSCTSRLRKSSSTDLPAIPLYYSNASGVASLNVKSGYAFDWQNLPTYTEMSKK